MIHKSFGAETKVLDPTSGLVECVFSVTSVVDRQNDRIVPGAFAKALSAKSSVPVVYGHSWTDINAVLGRTTSWAELMPGDPGLGPKLQGKGYGGVKATVQFELGVPAGQIAFTHVRHQNITDWSFAFDVDPDGGQKFEDGTGVREIKSVSEIYEVTLALIGANPEAMTLAVKKTMEMQRSSGASDAEQWVGINAYIARQRAAEEGAHAGFKAIAIHRTHVEKWIDDHEDRAGLPMTYGDLNELMACLERDSSSRAKSVSYHLPLLTRQALTPAEFKRLAESI